MNACAPQKSTASATHENKKREDVMVKTKLQTSRLEEEKKLNSFLLSLTSLFFEFRFYWLEEKKEHLSTCTIQEKRKRSRRKGERATRRENGFRASMSSGTTMTTSSNSLSPPGDRSSPFLFKSISS